MDESAENPNGHLVELNHVLSHKIHKALQAEMARVMNVPRHMM